VAYDKVSILNTETDFENPIQAPPTLTPAPPPVLPPSQDKKSQFKKKASWLGSMLLVVFAKLKTIGLVLLSALKYLKFGKILLTSGTMLLSIAAYSLAFGWKFAAGFVLCIFIHEMGHVFVGWRQKLPMSAPVFIPFMGAVIFNKRGSSSAWAQAIMGIGGPVAGTLAGLGCWAIFTLTGNPFFLALAYVTFFMNLFNLTPVPPLDGGWITGAVSTYLWAFGVVAMIVAFATGWVRNPLLLILVIMSLPRLWSGLRSGDHTFGGLIPATKPQKWLMGGYYLALAGFLFWAMNATNIQHYVVPRTKPVASMGGQVSPGTHNPPTAASA
jgi:Zn-dependent protease